MSKSEASRVFKVSCTTVHHWTKTVANSGASSLKAKKRRPRSCSRLLPHQAATAVRLMEQKCPDQLGLPFYLWAREAVQQFLAECFELSVSVWTVGRYLKQWGFTPQKSLRRADSHDPNAVPFCYSKSVEMLELFVRLLQHYLKFKIIPLPS